LRIKTFIATYLLFLFILYASVGVVLIYLSNSQLDMLRNKSAAQYQSIIQTLARDISILHGRPGWDVQDLVHEYARYFSRHNVSLNIFEEAQNGSANAEVTLVLDGEEGHRISIVGHMPEPFGHFLLEYNLNIDANIQEMLDIQQVLLLVVVVVSLLAAVALYILLAVVFRPMERMVRAEQRVILLQEEAESKQQFVDNFTHEIRTPLTSIYGFAEYLQKASLPAEEIAESAHFIMDETRHMKNIADTLLELATLRNFSPTLKEIKVAALFNEVTQSLSPLLDKKGVRMVYDTDGGTIKAQEDLIRSLLFNLCNNAIKACKPDAGEIKMEFLNNKIIVSDNGCGIPIEALPKLTEPFFRVDKARNRAHGGTGLGLTLCKQIAEVHGAKMEIASILNEGTRIIIHFTKP